MLVKDVPNPAGTPPGVGADHLLWRKEAAQAARACRRALALGADEAVLVEDDSLRGANALVTARVLAHAIRTLRCDLVLAGVESADGATGAVPGALAELLDLPAVTFARRVEITGDRLVAERQPFSWQIGQTGKTVQPRVYMAVGISGAPQHVIGVKQAHCILAINSDPAAPIFQLADLGVVGDARTVVTAVIERLEARRENR